MITLNRDVVEGFVGSCLVPYFDNATNFKEFHRELWDLCTGEDQFVAICAPRRPLPHAYLETVVLFFLSLTQWHRVLYS
jgi:hypothetical protein